MCFMFLISKNFVVQLEINHHWFSQWRSTVEQNRDSKQLLVIHISDLILIIK